MYAILFNEDISDIDLSSSVHGKEIVFTILFNFGYGVQIKVINF